MSAFRLFFLVGQWVSGGIFHFSASKPLVSSHIKEKIYRGRGSMEVREQTITNRLKSDF